MADLRIKDLGTAATLNADDFIVVDGASRASALKFDVNSLGSSNDRVFADDATVAPATAGLPTLSEVQTFITAGAYTDTLVYYTGTNTAGDTPTYVYMVDASGVATQVEGVVQPTLTPVYTGKSTTFAGLPTTRIDTSALIAGDRAALTKDVKGTGTKANPQYKAGMYFYDGSAWGFGYEFDSTRDADVLLDWTASTDYLQGETVLINGDLYVSNSERTSGATLDASEEANFTQVSTKPNARLFADDTTVAPAVSGTPTLAEIKTFIDTIPYVDGTVYYTGTDTDTDAPTYVYDVDKDGVLTAVVEPSEASKKLTDTEVYLSPSGTPYVASDYTVDSGNRVGLTQIGRTYIPSADSKLVSFDAFYLNSDQTGDLVDVYIYKGIGSSGVLLDTINDVTLGGIGSFITVTPTTDIVMNAGETYSYNVVKQTGTMDIKITNVSFTDGGAFIDGGVSDTANETSFMNSITISEAVTYNVFYETVDDVTVTKYAVNKDDVTDQPDISTGIPATWTLQSSADTGLQDIGVMPASVVSKGVYSAEGTNTVVSLYPASGLLGRVVVSATGSGVGTVIGVKAGESLNGTVDGTYTVQADGELLEFVDNEAGKWTVQVVGQGQTSDLDYALFRGDAQNAGSGGYAVWSTPNNDGQSDGNFTLSGSRNTVTIKANKTYKIELAWRIAGSGASGSNVYQIYDVTNSTVLGVNGISSSLNTGTNDSNRPISTAIVTPTTDIEIAAKQTGTLGEFEGYMSIQELPSTEVVMGGMLPVEDARTLLGNYQGGSGVRTVLDNGLTWNDVIANYESILMIANGNGVSYESSQIDVSDIDPAKEFRVWSSDSDGNWKINIGFEALTTGDLNFVSSSWSNVGIKIYGIKAQKIAIPPSSSAVNDQAASGYFDVGSMRLQWGNITSTVSNANYGVTLPAQFADDSYSVILTAGDSSHTDGAAANTKNTTSFNIVRGGTNGAEGMWNWFAIGLKP